MTVVYEKLIRLVGFDPRPTRVAGGKPKLDPRIPELNRSGAALNWLILRDPDHDAPCASELIDHRTRRGRFPPAGRRPDRRRRAPAPALLAPPPSSRELVNHRLSLCRRRASGIACQRCAVESAGASALAPCLPSDRPTPSDPSSLMADAEVRYAHKNTPPHPADFGRDQPEERSD